ncbi:hypothetical protein [Bosea beijingensis]
MTVIPNHEPEVIAARARRAPGGNDEKVATTSLKNVTVDGVYLSSRYDKAHELRQMARMVEAFPAQLRSSLADIWCDSKAQACYTVAFKDGTEEFIADLVLDALEAASSGHNGIWVQGTEANSRDPYWPGEDFPGDAG